MKSEVSQVFKRANEICDNPLVFQVPTGEEGFYPIINVKLINKEKF
ncbi:MAG: hypothetical protein ACE5HW_02525 [Candidatus Methanofastidiosia archaeon]